MQLVTLVLCLSTAFSMRVLLTGTQPPQIGTLNTTTGQLLLSPVKFPPVPGCKGWNLGANGTRGQTSAPFDMNGTWYVLAEGTGCGNAQPPVSLIAIAGPYSPGSEARTGELAKLTTTSSLLNMSIAWDFTCNVVVVTREESSSEVVFKTNQVSAYDGAQRFQPDYKTEPVSCEGFCWRKVGGIGGIDPTKTLLSGRVGELNCGDSCIFYSIEEKILDGKAVLPRQFVGRSFRTGKLLVNVTDSFQMETITYVPFLKIFLGIGRCCSQSWCPDGCRAIPDGDFAIFQYLPQDHSFVFTAHLGPETGEDPTSAVRIGVDVNSLFRPTKLMVVYDGKIVGFDLVTNKRTEVPLKSSQFIGAWAQNQDE